MRQRSCSVHSSAGSPTDRYACGSSRVALTTWPTTGEDGGVVWTYLTWSWFLTVRIALFLFYFLSVFTISRSVVVSLRLLPKLFGTFQQFGSSYDTHWITM